MQTVENSHSIEADLKTTNTTKTQSQADDALFEQLRDACEKLYAFATLSAPQVQDSAHQPEDILKQENKRIKNSSFAELINWQEVEGASSEEKARKVLNALQKLAQKLEIKIEDLYTKKLAAGQIAKLANSTQLSETYEEKVISSAPTAINGSSSFLSSALKRYHSLVARLGISTGEQEDQFDKSTLEDIYISYHTFRSIGPNNKKLTTNISPALLNSLCDSSIDEGIVFDLLQLASGGRLTPIPSRRELAEKFAEIPLTEDFADQEREINKFLSLINWKNIDGANPTAKVFNFLNSAEEVRGASNRKLEIKFNETFGEMIMSHIRGKRLAALDLDAHFSQEKSIAQDPASLLRRNFALRGTFRTFAAPGSPYLSKFVADHIMANAKVHMSDRVILCDVWNLVNGGELVPKSLWFTFLKNRFEQEGKSNEALKMEVERNAQVIELLSKIDWKDLPGENPRSKCISALVLLGKIAGNFDGINTDLSEDNLSRNDGKKVAKQINESVKLAKQLTESESKLLADAIQSDRRNSSSTSDVAEPVLRTLTAAMLTSPLMRQVGRIAHVLRSTSHFGPQRVAPVPKLNNQWQEVLELQELSQLRDALPAELAQAVDLPDLLLLKFGSSPPQGLLEPQLHSTKKILPQLQLLYLLVDCSGSMNVPERIGTAVALLTNRLIEVTRGSASLFYRFFDTQAHSQVEATNKEQASKALASLMQGHYAGGGTSIDTAIRSGVASIRSILTQNPMIKPELYVVSDGEDSVRTSLEELQGVKLHLFLVAGQRNEPLERLALTSGGMVMRVGSNGEVLQIKEHL